VVRALLAARARETWIAAGGTDEGWSVYRPEAAAAEAQWRAVGKQMPDFALEDTGGHPVRLGDLAGKTVFINVWATWCGPCQGELPWVQRLYEAMKDRRDVLVLTFNVDENPGILARYMQEHGLSFPVVLAQEFVNGVMKVEAIPRNWIVDGAGVLRFERSAGFDWSFVSDTVAAMEQAKRRQ
jgi:thiol-disulfide isomerase/thioredoxin